MGNYQKANIASLFSAPISFSVLILYPRATGVNSICADVGVDSVTVSDRSPALPDLLPTNNPIVNLIENLS